MSKFMAGLSQQLAVVEENVGHKIVTRIDSLEAKVNDQVGTLSDNFDKLENKFTQLNTTVQYNNQLANDNASKLAKIVGEQLQQKNEFHQQNRQNESTEI